MKKIFNVLLIILILNISTIFATPNRNQFKPMTIELDNESVAVISCRLVDYKGDCLKSDLIVNTPNGYTAPIDINEQQGGDKAIKLLAVSPIENGLSVVTYNENEELGLAQYIYDSNAKTLNRITYFNLPNTPEKAITLDISSRSSQLDYNNNQFFIILSTNDSSYFITADNNDFIYVYKVVDVAGSTDVSTHKLDYIAGNEEGTFTVVSYNRTCTPATNIYVNLFFINIDINTKIINVNSYSYSTPSCPNDGSTMLKYVSQSQILYTSSFLNKTTISLMDFPNSITFTFSRHKHFAPRDVQVLPLSINSVYNPSYVSSLTLDYSNINFRSTFSTFSFDGSDAVLSVERCCHGCYKNCLIEGHLLNLDLDNNILSRKSDSNGTFVDLPVVASTQLGFDRVRFDSDLPLFRYNVLCMNTDLI